MTLKITALYDTDDCQHNAHDTKNIIIYGNGVHAIIPEKTGIEDPVEFPIAYKEVMLEQIDSIGHGTGHGDNGCDQGMFPLKLFIEQEINLVNPERGQEQSSLLQECKRNKEEKIAKNNITGFLFLIKFNPKIKSDQQKKNHRRIGTILRIIEVCHRINQIDKQGEHKCFYGIAQTPHNFPNKINTAKKEKSCQNATDIKRI